jgi:hypothetical protein
MNLWMSPDVATIACIVGILDLSSSTVSVNLGWPGVALLAWLVPRIREPIAPIVRPRSAVEARVGGPKVA